MFLVRTLAYCNPAKKKNSVLPLRLVLVSAMGWVLQQAAKEFICILYQYHSQLTTCRPDLLVTTYSTLNTVIEAPTIGKKTYNQIYLI